MKAGDGLFARQRVFCSGKCPIGAIEEFIKSVAGAHRYLRKQLPLLLMEKYRMEKTEIGYCGLQLIAIGIS